VNSQQLVLQLESKFSAFQKTPRNVTRYEARKEFIADLEGAPSKVETVDASLSACIAKICVEADDRVVCSAGGRVLFKLVGDNAFLAAPALRVVGEALRNTKNRRPVNDDRNFTALDALGLAGGFAENYPHVTDSCLTRAVAEAALYPFLYHPHSANEAETLDEYVAQKSFCSRRVLGVIIAQNPELASEALTVIREVEEEATTNGNKAALIAVDFARRVVSAAVKSSRQEKSVLDFSKTFQKEHLS